LAHNFSPLNAALGFQAEVSIELYKFCTFEANSLSILINQQVWFSKPADFNDPFDGDFNVSDKCTIDDFLSISKQTLSLDGLSQFKKDHCGFDGFIQSDVLNKYKDIVRVFKNIGVLCLTPRRDSVLMWSHYADEHKGFSIKFDIPDSVPCTDINYAIKLPQHPLSFYYNMTNVNGFIEIQFTKHIDWRYENEIRVSVSGGNRLCSLPGKITEINFGCKMPENQKITISNLVKSLPYGDEVKLYNAVKNSNLALDFDIYNKKA
jgi:hypothetical protein